MDTNNNHEISLQQAIDMTTLYRASQPLGMPLSETFDAGALEKLLSTDGCASVRIYYGMNAGNQVHAILVAANSQNEDILPAGAVAGTAATDPVIIEDGIRCPPACPPKSPLNGG